MLGGPPGVAPRRPSGKRRLNNDPLADHPGLCHGALALLGGVHTAFAARGRGPILSNTYRWKGKAERRRADKRGEYRLVAVIFGGPTAFFALETVPILTLSKIPFLCALCSLGFDMV